MQKAFGIIGWIGTALVFAAVAIRFFYPAWNQYATYGAWAGLVCVLIYMAGQWRDVATFYQGRGARYGTMSIVSIIVFVVAAPQLANAALWFGPIEYFALIFFALAMVTLIGSSPVKALLSVVLGMLVSNVGLSPITGTGRFTFGSDYLTGGFDVLAGVNSLLNARGVHLRRRHVGAHGADEQIADQQDSENRDRVDRKFAEARGLGRRSGIRLGRFQ